MSVRLGVGFADDLAHRQAASVEDGAAGVGPMFSAGAERGELAGAVVGDVDVQIRRQAVCCCHSPALRKMGRDSVNRPQDRFARLFG